MSLRGGDTLWPAMPFFASSAEARELICMALRQVAEGAEEFIPC